MKTKFEKPVLFLLAVLFFTGMVVSCSDDKVTPEADKITLKASITTATTTLTAAVEGKNDGQYPTGSKAILQAAIDASQALVTDVTTPQTSVDNAVVSLNKAVDDFKAKVIAPIAEADLIGHWAFDEGTGTVANDKSASKFNGTLKTGPTSWGAGFATWTADRTGAAGKALLFDKGANVEVPYNTALNPAKMSISVWVKASETRADNRFIGLQSWVGYKFQLQSSNRPYFTINTTEGTKEEDATVELPLNQWHHLVATFGSGKLTFYIDGTMVKAWDKTGDGKSISAKPYNLVFGQDFPTDKYSTADGANFDNAASPEYHVIPLAWGGYYHGALDEIRMYKTVLTGSQVSSLYDREKP